MTPDATVPWAFRAAERLLAADGLEIRDPLDQQKEDPGQEDQDEGGAKSGKAGHARMNRQWQNEPLAQPPCRPIRDRHDEGKKVRKN